MSIRVKKKKIVWVVFLFCSCQSCSISVVSRSYSLFHVILGVILSVLCVWCHLFVSNYWDCFSGNLGFVELFNIGHIFIFFFFLGFYSWKSYVKLGLESLKLGFSVFGYQVFEFRVIWAHIREGNPRHRRSIAPYCRTIARFLHRSAERLPIDRDS